MLLIKMLAMASLILPKRAKFKLSMVKVEKVVNEPSNPISTRYLIQGAKVFMLIDPQRIPIRNAPVRLTAIVAQGNIPL